MAIAAFARSHLLPDLTVEAHLRQQLRLYSEPEHLTSTISRLSDELARHHLEILRLRTQLRSIQSDRAILQAYYNACRSSFAPIRRVPPEILTEVFSFCSSPTTPYLPVVTPRSSTPRYLELVLLVHRFSLSPRFVRAGTTLLWEPLPCGTRSISAARCGTIKI